MVVMRRESEERERGREWKGRLRLEQEDKECEMSEGSGRKGLGHWDMELSDMDGISV